MNDSERYEVLKQRQAKLLAKVAEVNGERNVYLKKMYDMGFNTVEELKSYIESKQKELSEQKQVIQSKLNYFESMLNEVESNLKGDVK